MTSSLPRTRAALIPLLEARGLRPGRRLGQNFLVDPQLADAIVRDAEVSRSDHVLEIGPGVGALTQPLMEAARHVTSVELDRGLHALLHDHLGADARLTLVHGDCLDGDDVHDVLRTALDAPRRPSERVLVVANLPYSVGTVVTARLLTRPAPPDALVLMLQREVVERLRAAPGSADYGPLAILVALTASVQVLRRVPPDVFHPRPRVESSIVRLVPRPVAERPTDLDRLSRLLAAGFRQRRKTLRANLSEVTGTETLRAAGLDPGARPETVRPEDWVRLASLLSEGRR
jgi:16S rRNA (adenine1518-N6/adenine1519-N6)-dimethyltransferase